MGKEQSRKNTLCRHKNILVKWFLTYMYNMNKNIFLNKIIHPFANNQIYYKKT